MLHLIQDHQIITTPFSDAESTMISSYTHCFFLKFSESRRSTSNFSSLFELPLGLTTFRLPQTAQGSLLLLGPMHQAPGVNWPTDLRNSSLSILSRTGSSLLNSRANGTPLWIMSSKCCVVNVIGCCFGGLSHLM